MPKPSETIQSYQWSTPNDFDFLKNKRDYIHHTVTGVQAVNAPVMSGQLSWAGGSASNAFTLTGLLATDIVVVANQNVVNAVSVIDAVPTADTLPVTWTGNPGATVISYVIYREAAGYSTFFVAKRPCTVTCVGEVHSTAETVTETLELQIEKLQDGDSPGSGTDILLNPIDLTATANTTVFPAIITGAFERNLAKGDRLALKLTGTPTNVDGITLSVEYIYQ